MEYFYYYTGSPPTFQCIQNKCGANYITYPGVTSSTTKTGYCDYQCQASQKCDIITVRVSACL